jgi:uncharacterized phage protein (TIGR01671 family)
LEKAKFDYARHERYEDAGMQIGGSMREILFRGKSKESGEWVQGQYVSLLDNQTGELSHFINTDHYLRESRIKGFVEIVAGIEVSPETIGQYTETEDANGNKIFESDVVRVDVVGGYGEALSLVAWGKQSRGWSLKCHYPKAPWTKIKYYSIPASKNIEIIGNMFDNPELITGGRQ